MFNSDLNLGWQTMSGTAYEVGLQLGKVGRDAMHKYIIKTKVWSEVVDSKHNIVVERMADYTQCYFPHIWQELLGLASGLELPIKDVFAWNCRGELLLSAPDGCTTIQLNDDVLTIAHNEDGMPVLKGHCFMAKIKVLNQSEFIAFCYPGSIPGHTFAITENGIVQAVNNIRLVNCEPIVPRMVVGRALLNCESLDEAIELIKRNCLSGGFHFSLCHQGDNRLISLEFGAGIASVKEVISVNMHANHAIHDEFIDILQLITDSSLDRQHRGDFLVNAPSVEPTKLLWDTGGKGLPIYRNQQDDPDDENTLATAVIRVDKQGIEWKIYAQPFSKPTYFGCDLIRKA